MRSALPLCLLVTCAGPALAQFDGLETEIVSVARNIGGRSVTTVRLYARLDDPGAHLHAVFGSESNPLLIETDDPLGFHQDVLGGDTSLAINPAVMDVFPLVRFDSWCAVGSDTMVGNTMLDVGIAWGPWNADGNLAASDGAWLELPYTPPTYAVDGLVLLGQYSVSTGQTVSGHVSMQGKTGADEVWQALDASFGVTAEPVGSSYCGPGEFNSTGASGRIHALGSEQVADQDLTLLASDLPAGEFVMFLTSLDLGFVQNPGGSVGNLCLSGQIGRFRSQIGTADEYGDFRIEVDLAAMPVSPSVPVQPGETWHFQAWLRDGSTSNFTDGAMVTFS